MRNTVFVALALVPLFAACSGAGPSTGIVSPDGGVGADGGTSTESPEDPEDDTTPHALGAITLGERHEAGDSESTPFVGVSFVPNVSKKASCGAPLDGCALLAAPKCAKVKGSVTGCDDGEACVWDDACKATCKATVECAKPCGEDQICVADPKSNDPSLGKCVKNESFDAGPLAFSGTAMAISLFPPYAYEPKSDGAPFVSGAALRVKAQGALEAGFEAFDESFTATSFIQTKPALQKVGLDEVFGTGPLTLGWLPGEDQILITLASDGGAVATCKAKDASGRFDVPRSVVDAVRASQDGKTKSGSLSVTIARQRQELKKDKKTKGKLALASVEPVGWLALTTVSSETYRFEGCSDGLTACGTGCYDLTNDAAHCGACDVACDDGVECVAGKCQSGGTCAPGPEDTLAKCSDGCSNDGDAYVDCDDYDCCPVRTNCPSTTACGK